jgi:hypothetical protein
MKKIHLVAPILALSVSWLSGCAVDTSSEPVGDAPVAPESAKQAAPRRVVGGPGTSAPHCVAHVSTGAVSCHASFPEAIAVATEGLIVDAPVDPKVALADPSFRNQVNALGDAPDVTVVIGIEFVDANFQGATLTVTAGSGCDGNPNTLDFFLSNLVPLGFNDVISSFESFSNCQTVLFQDINFGGVETQKAVSMSFVGSVFNDQASSIQWF